MIPKKTKIIKPYRRQEIALASPADVLIYGGSAGGGKTFTLLLECLRHINNPKFRALFFRRTTTQIDNPGGLWDCAKELYGLFNARLIENPYRAIFDSGAKITFSHLQHIKNIKDYQGAQVPLICFDELTHFQQRMFIYLGSRGRSDSGINSYVRATCNPTYPEDPVGGWLHNWVGWYIDQNTGYIIPERSGVIRYYVVKDDTPVFADTREELEEEYPDLKSKSFTFVLSRTKDNPGMLASNPDYLANLLSLSYLDRMQLYGDEELGGNWLIAPAAGVVVDKAWLEPVEAIPVVSDSYRCRFFDFAGTSPRKAQKKNRDPDFTASCLMNRIKNRYYIEDVTNKRVAPSKQDDYFLNLCRQDWHRARLEGVKYMVRFEVEPGSAAQREAARLIGLLAGMDVAGIPSTTDKLTRLKPFSKQAEAGNVFYLVGQIWNKPYLGQLHNFPAAAHDDMADTTSGAFNELAEVVEKEFNINEIATVSF